MSLTIFGASPPVSLEQQLSASPAPYDPSNPGAELVTATYDQKHYVLDSVIAKKGARGRSSWIRNEGIFVTEVNEAKNPRTVTS